MKKSLSSFLAIFLAAATAHAGPPAQKLLPDNTVVLITVPDPAQAWGVATNSAMAKLWRDPAMKAFTDKFMDRFQTAVQGPLEQQLGIHFADYQDLARGQMSLAFVPLDHPANPTDANSTGDYAAVFLLDSGDHSNQLATNLSSLKKKWMDAGKTLKTEKIRDVEFSTFITTSDDLSMAKLLPEFADTNNDVGELPGGLKISVEGGKILENGVKPPPEKVELTFGQSGSLLIVSQSREVIEKVLSRQAGGIIPPLDEQPAFQADYAARLQGAPLYAWFNVKAFLAILAKQQGDGGGDTLVGGALASDGMMKALGLDGLTTASVAYRQTPDGLNIRIFVGAPESSRSGLLKMLATEAKDSGPPSFVPADAVKFSRIRIDIPKNWKIFESTLNQLNPSYSKTLNYFFDLVGKDKDPNYDLKAELLASLGDDIISYQRGPAKTTMGDLKEPPDIYLIGAADPEKLAAALKVTLSTVAPGPDALKEREFLGRKIYSVTLPIGAQGTSRALHFAASGGYVALTGDVPMLEEYLRSGDSQAARLRDTPGLADAAQKAGGLQSGIFAFSNDKENMRTIVETLRKEQVSWSDFIGLVGAQLNPGKISTVEEAAQFKKWADFSLLPPVDTVTAYFNDSVWSGGFTPEGFSLNCFSPNPPDVH